MTKLRNRHQAAINWLLVCLATIIIGGCSGSSDGPDDKPPDGPTVVDQVSADVTEAGATLSLKNGMALEIPAGAVSGKVKIELSQYGEDKNFAHECQTVLNIETDAELNSGFLRIPLPATQDTTLLGAGYRSDDGELLKHLLVTCNTAGDTMIVSLADANISTLSASNVPDGNYVVEMGSPITVTQRYSGQFCYYEQDYGTCWATAWLMMMKSYSNRFAYDEIYKLLYFTEIGPNDGLNWRRMDDLAKWTETLINKKGEYATFCSYSNFINYVLDKLSQGYPVLANMNTHQGLFVGYEITNPGPNQTITLTYHDPQMEQQRLPYRTVSTAQLKADFWDIWPITIVNYFSAFCINEAPPVGRSLQTIEMMDTPGEALYIAGLEKGMAFTKGNQIVDRVIWDHSKQSGLSFSNSAGRPRDLSGIHLRGTRVWNMNLTNAATVKVKTSLYRVVNGAYKIPALQVKEQSLTVNAKSGKLYNEDFLLEDYAANLRYGDTLFAVEAELLDGANSYLDGFDVVFSHYPLRIHSLNPAEGEPGTTVTIRGVGFGKTTAQVTFSDVPTGIVSWSDTLIVAEVPEIAGSSDVAVKVGDYSSNTRTFTTASLLDQIKRCKFEQLNAFGVFQTKNGRMYGLFFPSINNQQDLLWNGNVATKTYSTALCGGYTESYDIRIVFDPSGGSIDSILGFNRVDYITNGKLRERTQTELGAIDLPLRDTDDDEGGYECYYWLDQSQIASKLTRVSWFRNSYRDDGSLYTSDTLTNVNWLDSEHEGEFKILLWERNPALK